MTNKWLKVALMVTAIATGTSIKIDAETVLYVPQDDRPVSLQYTVDTAREAGMTVLTPPQHLISGKTYQGQADQIMAWVEQNAGRADVMVLSTDTLIYGGLVDSRKHNIPLSTLQNRLKRIEGLKARNKNVRIYGFGTVMRSPRASGGGTEPAYYAEYGPTIFQIAALQDKLDSGSLTQEETQKLMSLQGGKTLPGYEDQTIDKTIAQHVEAVGGTMVTQGKPTVLLAVNTPLTTSTGESENFENFPMISNSTNAFVDRIQQAVDSGVNVSVADIAFNNGADNTLVSAMYKRDLLYKIGAYNGWNTASNTVGYAIAQGLLLKSMSPEGHRDMLTQQYLDNWAYQANIRKDIYRMQDSIRTDNVRYSGELNERLESYLGERIQDFAEKYLKINPRTVKATFPWGRLFETDITVYDKPVVPLEKELRLKREAEAKAKAEAEAKAKAEAAAKANGQAVPAQAAQPEKAATPQTPTSTPPVVKQPATESQGPRVVPTPAAVPGQ